jgi:hypothetical protein
MTTQAIDHEKLAETLSPEQFELLLRSYIEKQISRLTNNQSLIMLVVHTGYGSDLNINEAHWQVGLSSTQTTGEILEACITECNRRSDFAKSCTLRLIQNEGDNVNGN